MMGVETWLLLATLAVLAWVYSRWRHSYWSSKGVPSPPILPFLGHFHKAYYFNKKFWEYNEENYTKFYNVSMYGMYRFFKPILVTWDSEIVKHVLVKDFDHFTDRRELNIKSDKERDLVVAEMLALKNGAEWRSLRDIMTPAFTSGKIKHMLPLVCENADSLVKFSMKEAAENPHVDMKKNFGQYALDNIASCAFGIDCNSLVDENAEFRRNAENFFKAGVSVVLRAILHYKIPILFKLLDLTISPPAVDFFINVLEETKAARKAGMKRADFLDLLLEAQDNPDNPNSKHVLNDRSIVAQGVLFITTGYDTTTSLLAFSSFLLAKNKDQQQRLRDELRQMVAEHGGITYQGIMEAKLLDACLQESTRLYPPSTVLERSCTKSYRLPGTDVTLKPGDLVQVPIWNLHHDPRRWRDPEAFVPDRFLPENKGDIQPFTHMPFGKGPRSCIAMRFALMEAKVAMTKLLLQAELEVAPGHEEVALENTNGMVRAKTGIMLVLKPVSEK